MRETRRHDEISADLGRKGIRFERWYTPVHLQPGAEPDAGDRPAVDVELTAENQRGEITAAGNKNSALPLIALSVYLAADHVRTLQERRAAEARPAIPTGLTVALSREAGSRGAASACCSRS